MYTTKLLVRLLYLVVEKNIEKQNSRVLFKNQPKLSEDAVDNNRNELRMSFILHIEHFLSTDGLFKDKEVSVEFSHEGISSLVCFIETSTEKFVLKIPLNNNSVPQGSEALFLKTWEATGVSVPHVFREGTFTDHSYVLMQYVDAPTVEKKYKELNFNRETIYFEAGKILRAMHGPEALGFGQVTDGKGKYDSFKEWLYSADMEKREKYIRDTGLLPEACDSLSSAKNLLVDFVGESNKSSYCHFDYSTGHLFATEPMTVFDPNPLFNNGYIDLGRTLVNYIAKTGAYPEKIVEGYGGKDGINKKVLYASIFLNIVYKLPYQHQKGRMKVIKNFQDYIAQNKSILEN